MTDEIETVPNKPRGWPKGKPRGKKAPVDREPVHETMRPAAQKYEFLDDEDDDRLKVPKELIPDGMDYQWVTDSILGQPQPQRRARFERRAWTPVPAERHDGVYTPKGYKGEINVDGLVLMERPLELSIRARQKEKMKAREQVYVREQQLRGGDLGNKVAFDTRHQSVNNKISKSYEAIPVPKD